MTYFPPASKNVFPNSMRSFTCEWPVDLLLLHAPRYLGCSVLNERRNSIIILLTKILNYRQKHDDTFSPKIQNKGMRFSYLTLRYPVLQGTNWERIWRKLTFINFLKWLLYLQALLIACRDCAKSIAWIMYVTEIVLLVFLRLHSSSLFNVVCKVQLVESWDFLPKFSNSFSRVYTY